MSFLAGLCGCFVRDETDEKSPHSSSPETVHQRSDHNRVQTGSFTLSNNGQFIRTESPAGVNGHGPPTDSEDGGYSSVVPLPEYTARPMSLHEKTLESHMRDPSVSSETLSYPQDEKNRQLYDEEVTSDSSSAISFPSSFGNTSTATRETPPPPYSPRHSVMMSRSRSMSISSAMAVVINPPPSARLNASRTGPTYSEDDNRSIRRHRRVSWESR
ncbi:unnamed protein product [Penicillium salamii]|uniref:Uncharacterized protein n=1 Tax=Penicillium salamii TaxID=1612424 RepID=A0A9W4N896_9EURO|nr:unnamed protein product [Penicillium salamii]CAG8028964.1 unnamed protein product [Penicillium salamii]CAG8035263.1 unnamed protein product [Penicillium salamii]CAG8057184.1 unnamed protein product [Penicillium salamii]CAG8085174.1 unnamed protein product [Penicillium salamii]